MKRITLLAVILAALALFTSAALAQEPVTGPYPGESQQLNGSGATFPLTIYNAWNADYRNLTGVQVNYAGGGSGRGQRDIISGVVDFGGTDQFLHDGQLAQASCPLVHVPMVTGGIVMIYNIPELRGQTPLNLRGNEIAKIYLGQITRWNDPLLVELNPQLAGVDQAILPVFRADASGTTFNFTYFLASENQQWLNDRRVGSSINWLAGQSAQGNPGVANLVSASAYSLGYVELSFVGSLDYANIKNPTGGFVRATPNTIARAAEGVALPADSRIVLIYRSGDPEAYPISTFTWLMTCRTQRDAARGRALARYLYWAVTSGQSYAAGLGYAPLSDAAQSLAIGIISSITLPDGSRALP